MRTFLIPHRKFPGGKIKIKLISREIKNDSLNRCSPVSIRSTADILSSPPDIYLLSVINESMMMSSKLDRPSISRWIADRTGSVSPLCLAWLPPRPSPPPFAPNLLLYAQRTHKTTKLLLPCSMYSRTKYSLS